MSSFESWDTRNYERTDGRTDEQKKPAIEVGAPPKNTFKYIQNAFKYIQNTFKYIQNTLKYIQTHSKYI